MAFIRAAGSSDWDCGPSASAGTMQYEVSSNIRSVGSAGVHYRVTTVRSRPQIWRGDNVP